MAQAAYLATKFEHERLPHFSGPNGPPYSPNPGFCTSMRDAMKDNVHGSDWRRSAIQQLSAKVGFCTELSTRIQSEVQLLAHLDGQNAIFHPARAVPPTARRSRRKGISACQDTRSSVLFLRVATKESACETSYFVAARP